MTRSVLTSKTSYLLSTSSKAEAKGIRITTTRGDEGSLPPPDKVCVKKTRDC